MVASLQEAGADLKALKNWDFLLSVWPVRTTLHTGKCKMFTLKELLPFHGNVVHFLFLAKVGMLSRINLSFWLLFLLTSGFCPTSPGFLVEIEVFGLLPHA